MRWILGIIFFVGLYPVLPIMYFSLKDAGSGKDGYCFSVRMKKEWLEDAAVKEIQERYRRELKRLMQILALIPLVTLVIPTFSIPFTIWMLWLMAVCIVPAFPLIQANGKLKEWKRENGLTSEKTQTIYTEMKNAGSVRKVKLLPFLPPMLLSAAAGLWSVVYFGKKNLLVFGGMIVTFALITFACYGIAVWMDRQKTQVISSDSAVNVNYTRARKNLWKNLWLGMAWLNTVFTVAAAVLFAVDRFAEELLLWGSLGYGVLTLGLLIWFAKRGNAIDACYEEAREDSFADDDDAWLGGIVYYNKKDKRTMVSKRIGIGTTTNLATPAGKVLDGIATATFLILIPVCCIWVMLEEFTPMQLAVEENMLVAEQLDVDYEIPLDAIEQVELLAEKPRWKKVNGSAMDNLYKGTFRLSDGQRCQLFLNPQNEFFLQIETAEETYYMSAPDDEGTQEIYEMILEMRN